MMSDSIGASGQEATGLSPTVEPASSLAGSAASIPDASLAPIWRNGFGAAVEAIDQARRALRPRLKRSPAGREYDAALDAALQYAFDCTRVPFHIVDYQTANEASGHLRQLLQPWLDAQVGALLQPSAE